MLLKNINNTGKCNITQGEKIKLIQCRKIRQKLFALQNRTEKTVSGHTFCGRNVTLSQELFVPYWSCHKGSPPFPESNLLFSLAEGHKSPVSRHRSATTSDLSLKPLCTVPSLLCLPVFHSMFFNKPPISIPLLVNSFTACITGPLHTASQGIGHTPLI